MLEVVSLLLLEIFKQKLQFLPGILKKKCENWASLEVFHFSPNSESVINSS